MSTPTRSYTATRPDPAWKRRGTRKPATFFDRSKFLLLLAILFGLLVWNEFLTISPLGTFGDALSQVSSGQRWILVLAAIELVRQVHYLISERNVRWNRFWTDRVFGRWNRYTDSKFSSWTKFRISRALMIVVWVVVIAFVLGQVTDSSPVIALFQAPALLIRALPMIAQMMVLLVAVVLQFVAIFWFLSKGGVDTYYPDDIETRFTDVWGQDHVLARVQENIVLLERPEEIEDRGGHVPSGILLWGPPGTGKTLMAEAVAGETGRPYVFVDPGAFQNMFMGVGILKVKSLFRKLRKLALRYGGVIVFLDEADALGSRGNRVAQPGGVGGFSGMHGSAGYSPPAWDSHGCNGFSHLSGHSRTTLANHSMAGPSVEVPDGTRSRFMMGGAGGGGDMGTLQALLTELSGLKKPRGFVNRFVRRALGMRPKPPPKYRILVMMASNLPEALDPALLRPGRIDRIYRVGYPSKAGRIRTYQGYLDKVTHELTPDQLDKLATITPYATGATMKDLVNESLINAIREGRETITWKDVIKAKQLKELGPPEDVEYIERERHAVAVHEACHATIAWATRKHLEIDIATIEKGSTYLGMVASIPPEDQFTRWRSEYESDILVSLASLAGERMFYGGDNSSGVSGDLSSATTLAALMESHWGMGSGVSSLPALQGLGIAGGNPEAGKGGAGGGMGFGAPLTPKRDEPSNAMLGQRIEKNLAELLIKAEDLLTQHRPQVLALAHALESHKTLTGDDVIAVLEGKQGPLIDGRPYSEPGVDEQLEAYHRIAVNAHEEHSTVKSTMPRIGLMDDVLPGELATVGVGGHSENVPAARASIPASGGSGLTGPGTAAVNAALAAAPAAPASASTPVAAGFGPATTPPASTGTAAPVVPAGTSATASGGSTWGSIGAGAVAMVAAAIVWAGATAAVDTRIGLVAIVIGLAVGVAMAVTASASKRLPLIAAVLSLLGCVLGDAFLDAYFVAQAAGESVTTVLGDMFSDIGYAGQVFGDGFSAINLIFWLIAAYAGYAITKRGVANRGAGDQAP